jgi:4-azaleucine resistance transporter AzlC
MSVRLSFLLRGVRDTLPMLLGAAPFGLIFAALAISNGIPVWATMALSACVFAGSSQFVAINLIAGSAAMPALWLTTFIVNLRHALYSATLLPYARQYPARWRWILAFLLTDETFAVVEYKLRQQLSQEEGTWYWLGSSLAMYINWQIWTMLGIVVGKSLPLLSSLGLDFAMVATFVAIVAPQLRTRPLLLAALVSGGTAFCVRHLPYNFGLILGVMLGILSGFLVENYSKRSQ